MTDDQSTTSSGGRPTRRHLKATRLHDLIPFRLANAGTAWRRLSVAQDYLDVALKCGPSDEIIDELVPHIVEAANRMTEPFLVPPGPGEPTDPRERWKSEYWADREPPSGA